MRRLIRDRRGTTTVEFTVIAPLFLALFFAIVELTLAFYWWKSAEKAVMLGSRLAVVRDPAVEGLPERNGQVDANAVFGLHCRHDSEPCAGFATRTCSGGNGDDCDGEAFDLILTRMQQIFPPIEADHLTITYTYIGLGYVGGQIVPAVTVELDGLPAPFIALNAVFGLLGGDARAPVNLPPIRATLTGEDLNTSGAG
jgi:hypothetical protein